MEKLSPDPFNRLNDDSVVPDYTNHCLPNPFKCGRKLDEPHSRNDLLFPSTRATLPFCFPKVLLPLCNPPPGTCIFRHPGLLTHHRAEPQLIRLTQYELRSFTVQCDFQYLVKSSPFAVSWTSISLKDSPRATCDSECKYDAFYTCPLRVPRRRGRHPYTWFDRQSKLMSPFL